MRRIRAPKDYKTVAASAIVILAVFALIFFTPSARGEVIPEVIPTPNVTITITVPQVVPTTVTLPPQIVQAPPITERVTVPGPTQTVPGPVRTVSVPQERIVTQNTTVTNTATITAEPSVAPTITTTATVNGVEQVTETKIKRVFTPREIGISLASLVVGAIGVLLLLYLTNRYTKKTEEHKRNKILNNLSNFIVRPK